MAKADPASEQVHYIHSSYREMVLEHLFLGELLRALWDRGIRHAEVLKSAVDDSGYDIVIDCGIDRSRYIQLKSRTVEGRAAKVTVNMQLLAKPGAAIVWMLFDPSLRFDRFLLFEPTPANTTALKVAKHSKGNAQGFKKERENHREVPISHFKKVPDIAALSKLLFPQVADGA